MKLLSFAIAVFAGLLSVSAGEPQQTVLRATGRLQKRVAIVGTYGGRELVNRCCKSIYADNCRWRRSWHFGRVLVAKRIPKRRTTVYHTVREK